MEMLTATRDLVEQLYQVEGKAEIVHGEIVYLPMTGLWPVYASGEIFASLRIYAQQEEGLAVGDGGGFLVNLPHRRSFSPDAAYYAGADTEMKFCEGAPVFAAEVRSENDYGPAAEREMEAKRADYFDAGTLVVWAVDLLGEDVVRVFRNGESGWPAAIYRRGQTAEAEPAVPGWTLAVDLLFKPRKRPKNL